MRRREPHSAALQRGGEEERHGSQDQAGGGHDQGQVRATLSKMPITTICMYECLYVFVLVECVSVPEQIARRASTRPRAATRWSRTF